MFPDFLYRLLGPADEQARLLDPLIDFQGDSDANQLLVFDAFQVPDRFAWIILALANIAQPGAGQNVVHQALDILTLNPDSGVIIRRALLDRSPADGVALAANNIGTLAWRGWLLLPARTIVRYTAGFNAAVQINNLSASIVALQIPLGNLERL